MRRLDVPTAYAVHLDRHPGPCRQPPLAVPAPASVVLVHPAEPAGQLVADHQQPARIGRQQWRQGLCRHVADGQSRQLRLCRRVAWVMLDAAGFPLVGEHRACPVLARGVSGWCNEGSVATMATPGTAAVRWAKPGR